MVDLNTSTLEEQLRRAEEAAQEVNRLEQLASQAPALRERIAKIQRQEERELNRRNALDLAEQEILAASEKQAAIPANLDTVSRLVFSLYSALKEIDNHRKAAVHAMGVVDQMDYEQELEELGEQQKEMGRDPQTVEYLVASRHGQTRIKQLIDQLDPEFGYLRSCDMKEPLRRDVANFILAQVVSPDKLAAEKSQTPAPQLPAQPTGIPRPTSNGNGFSGDEDEHNDLSPF